MDNLENLTEGKEAVDEEGVAEEEAPPVEGCSPHPEATRSIAIAKTDNPIFLFMFLFPFNN